MAKWFPLWLAKNYAMLWFAKGKEKMDFQEVQKILRTSDSMAAKTLNQLEIRGALIKTRKEIDPRIKEYKLIPPEKLFIVHLRYLLLPLKPILEDKLKTINLSYAITDSSASTYYQSYVYPPRIIEIKVKSADLEEWIAYLSDERTKICIKETFGGKQKIVRLIPISPMITIESVRTRDGLYIEPINKVLFELLKNQTITDLRALGAILIKNKSKIDWKSLAKEGDREFDTATFCAQLGCFIDILNAHAKEKIFSEGILNVFRKYGKKFSGIFIRDPSLTIRYNEIVRKFDRIETLSPLEQEEVKKEMKRYDYFKEFGEKWNLTAIVPIEEIKKILRDLRYD